jgi:hypothetical protein
MSNNKQSVKLYTEEQVREAIEMAREGIRSKDGIIDTLNFMKPPIELPSDEEINEKAFNEFCDGQFIDGAKCVINKLQGGNNENN